MDAGAFLGVGVNSALEVVPKVRIQRMYIGKKSRVAVVSVVTILCFVPLIVRAMIEVLHGHGAGDYQNVYGLPIHWTSLLIMIAVLLLALAIAFVARAFYYWRSRRGL